ncbi:hypothetical protein [Zavarzinella formosa]|uniref:hypothetical protein n=1 Tax=Zavarzinella formosa TaxID=360055 RepID=UPI0002D78712|nr:hypothetical protein [Zavarzinella formosa]
MSRYFLLLLFLPTIVTAQEAWPFDPKPDDFSKDALFDLRSLNEKVAGENGFITVSKDGDFLDGAGKPIRFWGINTNVQDPLPQYSSHPKKDLERHARFLAKRGVNMVRWHGADLPNAAPKGGASNDPTRVNEPYMDRLFQLVAAMKKEGIYTTVSPYWANALRVPRTWNIDGPDRQDSHGLLFFNPKLREIYKGWLKTLFTTKNPYTGLALKDDPALAIIQIQNEDSLLFWTFQGISGPQKEVLGEQFAAWAGTKYGSLEKAQAAWNNTKVPGDDAAAKRLGFYGTWDMTRGAPKWEASKGKRLADQLEFLTETMREFNQSIIGFLRNDVGCKQVVNCGNWRSADTFLLDDAERYSYTPGEVIGVNRYFSPPHLGVNRGWAITGKDTFASVSVLQEPRELPVNLKQVRGKAMILPESAWVTPNEFQAEGAFLAAAYQSLSGVDCFYWFATTATEWMPPTSANGFNKETLGKWVIATPTQLGQFPAAAYLFRTNLVKKGTPAVVEYRPLPDLWNRNPPLIAEDPGYDPNRDTGNTAKKSEMAAIDPLAFYVGPVEVVYGGKANETTNDSAKFIDQTAKTVKSNTGELTLDWGKQVAIINAPNAQGICGFLKKAGGTFKTDGLEITSENDYAAILAVSLDGKPIQTSGKILLQIGTKCHPKDWKETAKKVMPKGEKPFDGKEVDNIGSGPWMVDATKATVSFTSPGLSNATLLDANFNPVAPVKSNKLATGTLKVTLPPEAMYVIVR